MAGHAQLKFLMTECSKTQIRLTGPTYAVNFLLVLTIYTDISQMTVFANIFEDTDTLTDATGAHRICILTLQGIRRDAMTNWSFRILQNRVS